MTESETHFRKIDQTLKSQGANIKDHGAKVVEASYEFAAAQNEMTVYLADQLTESLERSHRLEQENDHLEKKYAEMVRMYENLTDAYNFMYRVTFGR